MTLKRVRPAQTLLEAALGRGIGLHHDCGGICACSTCHVYVEDGGQHLEKAGRREKDYLGRVTGFRESSRLACQCLLPEGRGRLVIAVPDQTLHFK